MVHGTLGLAYAPGLRLAVLRKKLEGARIPACTMMHRNVGVYMRAKLNYLVIEKKTTYIYINP